MNGTIVMYRKAKFFVCYGPHNSPEMSEQYLSGGEWWKLEPTDSVWIVPGTLIAQE